MFCTKCGKQIDYDAYVCDECAAAEAAANAEEAVNEEVATPAVENEVMETPVAAPAPTPAPVEAPINQAPVYNQAPVNQAPNYNQAPVYQAPVYQAPAYAAPVATPAAAPADADNKMFGFGKALTSTLLGFFGFIFSIICFASSAVGGGIIGFIFFYPAALTMAIISLIFGIKSISTFKARGRACCAKPIATLILGIVGVVLASLAFLYIFLGFITACAFCMEYDSYGYYDDYYYY